MLFSFTELIHTLKKNLYFINDLRDIDAEGVLQKIKENTSFSISYIILLSSATIVCTLGLLLNSAPIVIGGMLISPLMWPLMKIAIGVSFERKSLLIQAIYLLIFSILISFISSIFITAVVPLKIVTNEILSRSSPTFLDIFVAIAAGSIAAFSIIQKKISDSLAGVAIATSLMPPLCVAGIGFVLGDYAVATGGFFLFFTNIISIIFISVFIFTFIGVKKDSSTHFRRKGIIYIIAVLLLTSIPLLNSLQNYTFKIKAYQESKKVIAEELFKISPELSIENISTSPDLNSKDTILVDADIVSPETINLDYTQKEKIVSSLEEKLGKKINLNLRVQKTISLKSKKDILNGTAKKQINDYIENSIDNNYQSITLGNIESVQKDGNWQIVVVLRAEPDTSFKEADRQAMQNELEKILAAPVSLSINLVPLLSLTNDTVDVTDEVKSDIEDFMSIYAQGFELNSVSVTEESRNTNEFDNGSRRLFDIQLVGYTTSDNSVVGLELLQTFLSDKYKSDFRIELTTTEVTRVILN